MHEYPFDRRDIVERSVGRDCEFFCGFNALCTTELVGGNTVALKKLYKVGDPMDYYQDRAGDAPGSE